MPRFALTRLAAAGALALTACSEELVAPAPDLAPSLTQSAVERPGRYVVLFRASRGVPRGFPEEVERLGGAVEALVPEIGAAVVARLTAGAAAQLARSSGVQSVDPDPVIPMRTTRAALGALDASIVDAEIASPALPHTAGFFFLQWNLRAIAAQPAWLAGFVGSPSVRVAILDTGIDEGHPGIAAQRNLDLLGRVDGPRSRSFMPEEDAVVRALFPGAPLYTDLDGHGTNVASQVSSNAINLAGVTSGTALIALKVCTILPPAPTPANPEPDPGYCSFAAIFQAIVHAVAQDADVINLSLGGGFPKSACPGCPSILNRIITYANSHGVTVVAAAGNEARDLDHDRDWYHTFCSVPHVICVAATGAVSSGPNFDGPFVMPDAPALYSNFGRSAIDVSAPGGNFELGTIGDNGEVDIVGASFVWSLCPRRTAAVYHAPTRQVHPVGTCGIWGFIGTSQASPHVAGLAALLVERYGRNPGAIQEALQSSADQLGRSGNDPRYGRGRIHVARAVGLE